MEYASSYVIRIAGASQRQLQLWDEQNLVSPCHAGHRLYTSDEVIEVAIVAELRRKGKYPDSGVHHTKPARLRASTS